MRRIVRIGALAVVAVGLTFVVPAPSRANGCRVAPAARCATYHHCHHYRHCHHVGYVAAVAPSRGCTTSAPVVVTVAPTVVRCTTCCPVHAVRFGRRVRCVPIR